MPDKKYQVANPEGRHPEGTRILTTATGDFYEGDEITPADLVDAADLAAQLKQGTIVEVKPERRRKEVTDAG